MYSCIIKCITFVIGGTENVICISPMLSISELCMLNVWRCTKLFPFLPLSYFPTTATLDMGIAFDYAPERPDHINEILNSLDRYNPETTTVLQDYVTQQCEDRSYDCYANLALLKL